MNDTPESDYLESNLGNAAHPALSSFCRKLEHERDEAREQRDRLAEAVDAATILIAAKGRYNTMLAYQGLQEALESLNHFPQTPAK